MGWYRVQLSVEQQQVVNAERDAHPDEHVRRKMLVLWLLHCGLTRAKVAEITSTGRATVQRYVVVQAVAKTLGIDLLYLPSYSPNLNLIERLWRLIKRRTLYGKYYPVFADFKAAIEQTIRDLPTKYKDDLQSLMTHNFQEFEDVSLLAA